VLAGPQKLDAIEKEKSNPCQEKDPDTRDGQTVDQLILCSFQLTTGVPRTYDFVRFRKWAVSREIVNRVYTMGHSLRSWRSGLRPIFKYFDL
jgi:hypothetical protein